MNIIAIDSSTPQASVALWTGHVLLERLEATQKNHASVILPLIDELLEATKRKMSDINSIVFGCGPGSFTGLRIACSLAKGLAFAHNLPLYPVSSLFNMAYAMQTQKTHSTVPVLSLIDAHMQEVYWRYTDSLTETQEEFVTPMSAITAPGSHPLLLAHADLPQELLDELPDMIKKRIQQTCVCLPSAATMLQWVLEGMVSPVSAEEARPVYIRNKVTHG